MRKRIFWKTLHILEESITLINYDKQVLETIVERVEPSDSTLNLNMSYTTLSKIWEEVLQTDHNPHPRL